MTRCHQLTRTPTDEAGPATPRSSPCGTDRSTWSTSTGSSGVGRCRAPGRGRAHPGLAGRSHADPGVAELRPGRPRRRRGDPLAIRWPPRDQTTGAWSTTSRASLAPIRGARSGRRPRIRPARRRSGPRRVFVAPTTICWRPTRRWRGSDLSSPADVARVLELVEEQLAAPDRATGRRRGPAAADQGRHHPPLPKRRRPVRDQPA